MTELRWVLLALGALLILGVYLFSRGYPQKLFASLANRPQPERRPSMRVEPELEDEPVEPAESSAPEDAVVDAGPASDSDWAAEAETRPSSAMPDRVVTIRFIPHTREIACDRVILALRAAGLKHGRYGIFHSHADEFTDEPLFSVASLTEPGSFDMNRLAETKIPGMSFFMVLPGSGDPVARFDRMVATARELARELDGELRDEKGSSWSIQRERYVREEIIEYRHSLDLRLPG